MSHTEEPFYCANFKAPSVFRGTICSRLSRISEIIVIVINIIIIIIIMIIIVIITDNELKDVRAKIFLR